jgi:predicted site-specific integrase-resolvase
MCAIVLKYTRHEHNVFDRGMIVAHKDRLVRFGFPWFERFCTETGPNCRFATTEQLSPEQEMVDAFLRDRTACAITARN